MTSTPPRPYPGLCGPFVPAASDLFRCATIARRDRDDVRYLPAERPVRVERVELEYQR